MNDNSTHQSIADEPPVDTDPLAPIHVSFELLSPEQSLPDDAFSNTRQTLHDDALILRSVDEYMGPAAASPITAAIDILESAPQYEHIDSAAVETALGTTAYARLQYGDTTICATDFNFEPSAPLSRQNFPLSAGDGIPYRVLRQSPPGDIPEHDHPHAEKLLVYRGMPTDGHLFTAVSCPPKNVAAHIGTIPPQDRLTLQFDMRTDITSVLATPPITDN